MTAARVFRYVAKCSRRIWEGYVRDSQLAFARAGATALIRVITTEFADVFGLGDVMPIKQPVVNGRATHRDSSEILPHSDSSSGSDIKTPWTQDEPSALSQRLNFESILKSFLAFASEKDRRKLIKQVLTVLIQVRRKVLKSLNATLTHKLFTDYSLGIWLPDQWVDGSAHTARMGNSGRSTSRRDASSRVSYRILPYHLIDPDSAFPKGM